MKIDVALLNMEKETKAVNGDLYINDVHCAAIQLYSRREPIKIQATGPNEEQLIREAEKYCNNLYQIRTSNEQVEYIPLNLDLYMKDQIKLKLLDMLGENCIVYGKENTVHETFTLSPSVKTLLKSPIGKAVLAISIQNIILPELKEGEKIWQANLPDKVVKAVGEEHFHPPVPKYVKKEDLRMVMDRPRGKGGHKL